MPEITDSVTIEAVKYLSENYGESITGANLSNVRALAHADLDVINVGSAISQAPNPAEMFQKLVAEIDKNGVVL